ncbi:MAG: hypothetical protein AB7G75_10990 [Candidatus Binatia bacterium]
MATRKWLHDAGFVKLRLSEKCMSIGTKMGARGRINRTLFVNDQVIGVTDLTVYVHSIKE